jgi:DNA-binding SARP family transcriptional activator
MKVRYRVLGSFELLVGDRICTPSAPKVRQLLAHLLMNPNQIVPIDSIIEELWGDRPPASAVTTTQTYVYQLRRLLVREGVSSDGEDLVMTRAPGYMIRTEPDEIDAELFHELAAQAQRHLGHGRAAEASESAARALALWSGPAMSNVTLGTKLEACAVRLEEQRLRVNELRIEAEMSLGRHRDLISDLRSLVVRHPLNEWFHAQLILALQRSGRRSEALQAYRSLRALLSRELGVEPSDELQVLHRAVLDGSSSALLSA